MKPQSCPKIDVPGCIAAPCDRMNRMRSLRCSRGISRSGNSLGSSQSVIGGSSSCLSIRHIPIQLRAYLSCRQWRNWSCVSKSFPRACQKLVNSSHFRVLVVTSRVPKLSIPILHWGSSNVSRFRRLAT